MPKPHPSNIVILLGIASVGAVIGSLALNQLYEARRLAAYSNAEALWEALNELEAYNKLTDKWHVFSDVEHERTTRELARNRASLDPNQKNWKPGDALVDIWGNLLQIAGRRRGNTTEYIVWSKGPDGDSGTQDDIVVPYVKSGELKQILAVGSESGLD